MKAGTTTLHNRLAAYPDLCPPSDGKEPHTLVKPLSDSQIRDEYRQLFNGTPPNTARRFESSTGYAKLPAWPETAKRARRILGPELKIIYLVRNPIDRLVSHKKYMALDKRIPEDINRAVHAWSELVDFGRYQRQLDAWRAHLPDQQIKVIIFEEFVRMQQSTVDEVRDFLGLPILASSISQDAYTTEHANASTDITRPSKITRLLRQNRLPRAMLSTCLSRRTIQRLKQLLEHPVPHTPIRFERKTLDWLVETFTPDTRAVQQFLNRADPPWDLAATANLYHSQTSAPTGPEPQRTP